MITSYFEDELECLHVKNAYCEAKIALQGAHLFYFKPHDKTQLLFLSSTTQFKQGKAIRGGIPICWPWFDAHYKDASKPRHGFARTSTFRLSKQNSDHTKLSFELKSSKESLKLWSHKFKLTLTIELKEVLKMSLKTENLDDSDFFITQAFHTYLHVKDIQEAKIYGLANKRYLNKLDEKVYAHTKKSVIINGECDRIYCETNEPIILKTAQQIRIESKNSQSTVVWNPWKKKAKKLDDLDSYEQMLCIESANLLDDIKLVKAYEATTLHVKYSFID